MKCSKCQYYNMPGTQTCAQCGSQLSDTAGGFASPEEFYPKRASQRSLGSKLEHGLGKPGRQAVARLEQLQSGIATLQRPESPRPQLDFRQSMVISLSVIPGVAQFLQRRQRIAAMLWLGTLGLVLLGLLTIHWPISNLIFWTLIVLCGVSVFDTIWYWDSAQLRTGARRDLRALRVGFLSVMILVSTIVGVLLLVQQRTQLWVLQSNAASPVLQEGDGLIVQTASSTRSNIRRGDLIVYSADVGGGFQFLEGGERFGVERVLGVSGDRISTIAGRLWVNGAPVSAQAAPITVSGLINVSPLTVPSGQVAVMQPTQTYRYDQRAERSTTVLLVSVEEVRRILGLYEPPQRRRWFPQHVTPK